MYDNKWWPQCEPCDEKWDVSCSIGSSETTELAPAPKLAPQPEPSQTSASSRGPSPSPVSDSLSDERLPCEKTKYAQCGGEGFVGETCCPVGMWCMYDNKWWSQCEPCDEKWDAVCSVA